MRQTIQAPDVMVATKRLLAADVSFEDEARSSWIQRLCGAHQYSMARLTHVTGIKPPSGDWDRPIGQSQWMELLSMAGLRSNTCAEANFGMAVLHQGYSAKTVLLRDSKGRPCSRWCSLCLADDEVPYMRWDWRIAGNYQCSKHQVALDEHCPWCGECLLVDRALLVFTGVGYGVPDLATCNSCGMSRCDKGEPNQVLDDIFVPSQDLLDELLSLLKWGYRVPDKQLELDFERYASAIQSQCDGQRKQVPDQDEQSWVNLSVSRIRDPASLSLRIDGHVFREHLSLTESKNGKGKWNRLFSPNERERLTRAIRLVRSERTELCRQEDGLSPPNVGRDDANIAVRQPCARPLQTR